MASILAIEGVGESHAKKLKSAGIGSVEALLAAGATPKGRKQIVTDTGLSEKQVLRWVNHADLFRIKGIGKQFAELLEAAGVDTVVELGKRDGANLHEKMVETNKKKKLTRGLPSEGQVSGWVSQAKKLKRVVSY